ncbi:hypothetical protein, partial [Burkholderia sp. SIMBA_024]|uniref:hypothetical protein n=1 Tax=Burkholderia sp. SIMBA_024 TaxID=3085768 RepID=UPI003979C1FC
GLPVLAVAGAVASGMEIARATSEAEAMAIYADAGATADVAIWVAHLTNISLIAFAGLVGLALSARGVRALAERRSRWPKLRYP